MKNFVERCEYFESQLKDVKVDYKDKRDLTDELRDSDSEPQYCLIYKIRDRIFRIYFGESADIMMDDYLSNEEDLIKPRNKKCRLLQMENDISYIKGYHQWYQVGLAIDRACKRINALPDEEKTFLVNEKGYMKAYEAN